MAAVEAALARGQSMTVDQAVAYTLRDLEIGAAWASSVRFG
jgi:hypothetical protein